MTVKVIKSAVLLVVIAAAASCSAASEAVYKWKDTPGQHLDLEYGGKKVLRYMYAHDTSTKETRLETYKPFYHVYDLSGENLLTKGSGGRYTHHRGIMLGWNKLTCDGAGYDSWHMKGIDQVHKKILKTSVNADSASATTEIDWVATDGTVIIREARQVTVSKMSKKACDLITGEKGCPPSGCVIIDVTTSLDAVGGDLVLDGDPEHTGFQYRAHNDVNEAGESDMASYMYCKDGVAEQSTSGKKKKVKIPKEAMRDMPWAAMSYGLNGKKYTVQHLNSPDNPKPYHYSAYRTYGRFGSFSAHELKKNDTLQLSWRIIVQESEMLTRKALQKRYDQYASGVLDSK